MTSFDRVDYRMSMYRPFSMEHQLERFNSDAGYYFFTPDSKRFFSSHIGAIFHGASPANWNIFVTSERDTYSNQPRYYTVRQLLIDGSVETLSEFQQYTSAAQAKRAIQKYLKFGTAF